jgi:hypothetical protein
MLNKKMYVNKLPKVQHSDTIESIYYIHKIKFISRTIVKIKQNH